MITEGELFRLLELADPALVDDPAPVLDAAEYRAALNTTSTNVTLIDHEPTPTQPTSGRRWLIPTAAAAAVVVAIAFVATRDDDVRPADQPSPTVTVPPASPPRALPRTSEPLVAGTYFVDELNRTPTPRIFFTVGAGWYDPTFSSTSSLSSIAPRNILNHSIGAMSFSRPDRVFSHVCRSGDGFRSRFHPGPVDTVDGLVAALSEQGGWAEVSAPSEIFVDGYSGKAFQRTARTEFSGCDQIELFGGTRLSDGPVRQPDFVGAVNACCEPGQTETLWALNIEGMVVLISAGVWPGPAWGARADAAADVLDSIRIERSSSPDSAASEPNPPTPLILPVAGREWSAGALAPDLGQFTDQTTLIDALTASGPLENQSLSDPNVRPGVSICADIVRHHEPSVGTLVHEATAVLNRQVGVVLVFEQPDNTKEVHMYGTGEADPRNGACPQLMREPLQPGPTINPLPPD